MDDKIRAVYMTHAELSKKTAELQAQLTNVSNMYSIVRSVLVGNDRARLLGLPEFEFSIAADSQDARRFVMQTLEDIGVKGADITATESPDRPGNVTLVVKMPAFAYPSSRNTTPPAGAGGGGAPSSSDAADDGVAEAK